MTHSSGRLIAERLANQRLTRPGPVSAAGLVAWFGAVQAQEYGPAKWGLAQRLGRPTTDAALDRAINQGRVLRTHVLRPTWHFVTPADIRWMLELTGPLVQRRMATYDRQFGLTPRIMTRAAAIMERALDDVDCLSRAELGARLERGGIAASGQRLAHLVMYAELHGVICSGPRTGKQPTYSLLTRRAPRARRLVRDQALAELARRFLRSHGPATIRDYVWWSGLTTADARRGFDIARAQSRDQDGLRYWSLRQVPGRRLPRNRVHLLPIYDEYLVAYRDRVAVPHAEMSMGKFWHAVVLDGHVAGTWRTRSLKAGIGVDVTLSERFGAIAARALARAAADYGRFLGVPVVLSVG